MELLKKLFISVACVPLVSGLLQISVANAESADCQDGRYGSDATCRVEVSPSPVPGGSPVGGVPGGDVARCFFNWIVIPCTNDLGVWDGHCYVAEVSPQPPFDDPVWDGHRDGVIYRCTNSITNVGLIGVPSYDFWSAAPGGIEPGELAQQLAKTLELRAFRMGMNPDMKHYGVVGAPMWFWVADPGEHTWGPISATAESGGVRVTGVAKVTKVGWSMGNGDTVYCGLGTVYMGGDGVSPSCGYTYRQRGTYTIKATSYWVFEWSSNTGVGGKIPVQVSSTRELAVKEIQVVRDR